MVFADPLAVFTWCDEIPDEGLDLFVALVRVDTVQEGHPDGLFHVLSGESFAKVGMSDHFFPSSPTKSDTRNVN